MPYTSGNQCALLEDELIQTQMMLRKARANVAGLVQMNDDTSAQRDEAMRNLRKPSGELAIMHKQLYDLGVTLRGHKREADRLRGVLNGLTPNSKTII